MESSSTDSKPTRGLADGNQIPLLGLGVWQVENGPVAINAVRWALEGGYRHIDTAQAYGNEASVGRALRQSGVGREEVFITTKFFPGDHDPVAALEASLPRLGLDYVDLYLVHWPAGGPTWAWPGMEQARARGYTRSIGVSNFGVDDLRRLLAVATVPPAIDQVQFSPFEFRRELFDYCQQQRIALEAYSPLGTGRHLRSHAVAQIARRHVRTPAQVLLRWGIERNIPVVPKSTHRERIVENALLFEFQLTELDIAELDALDRTGGAARALERTWWR